MASILRRAKKIYGGIKLPGDKSISHRAIMAGSIAKGITRADNVLDCDDCNYTTAAFRAMGIEIKREGDITVINGRGLKGLHRPAGPISLGNSGTSMRILPGILAGQDFEVVLTADIGLSKRPMKRIVEPLSLMGVKIEATGGEYPPITIKGGTVKPIDYTMRVPSAQIKSSILFAGLFAGGVTKVRERFKSRDHTERILKYFGADIRVTGRNVFIKGGRELKPKDLSVPADVSSASFFLAAAAMIPHSKIRIDNVGINPTRAGILKVLKKMGARIKILNKKNVFEPSGDIEMASSELQGMVVEEAMIPSIIDELPIIFVLAATAKGRTVIRGAEELRVKETDRIRSMVENLKAMGAEIEPVGNKIIIEGVPYLKGADLKSYNDHRTCMAMAIASLAADTDSSIDDIKCVSKSFPEFFNVLDSVKE